MQWACSLRAHWRLFGEQMGVLLKKKWHECIWGPWEKEKSKGQWALRERCRGKGAARVLEARLGDQVGLGLRCWACSWCVGCWAW